MSRPRDAWDDVMATVQCQAEHPMGIVCTSRKAHEGSHRGIHHASGYEVVWAGPELAFGGRCEVVHPTLKTQPRCELPGGHGMDHRAGTKSWGARSRWKRGATDVAVDPETVAAVTATPPTQPTVQLPGGVIRPGERVALTADVWQALNNADGSAAWLDGMREALRELDGRIPKSCRSGVVVAVHRVGAVGNTVDQVAEARLRSDVVTVLHDSEHTVQWQAVALVHWDEPPEERPGTRPFEDGDADYRARLARRRKAKGK